MKSNTPILKAISSTDSDWERFSELYIEAFPIDERRTIPAFISIQENEEFFANKIIENQVFIGLFNYWKFDSFYYIEHFAMDVKKRNLGYGTTLISNFLINKIVVLECELPSSQEAIQRLNFYERLGFKLFPYPYLQPPYSINTNSIKMHLLTNSIDLSKNSFDHIVDKIKKSVYHK